MANHSATKKAIRRTARATAIKRSRKARIRTFIKKVESAINEKNHTLAMGLFKEAQSEIARGVTKNVFAKNTAARKISRLNARIKAIA